jgi:hypothetical protein
VIDFTKQRTTERSSLFNFKRTLRRQRQRELHVDGVLANAPSSMANMPAHNQPKWRSKPLRRNLITKPITALPGVFALFALFAVMTVILFWQWMPHLHSALIGPPEDNMQDFWNIWYAAVARKPTGFFLPI